jgi:hypothetical protein
VFPVRYGLYFYILLRMNSVFKGLNYIPLHEIRQVHPTTDLFVCAIN